MLQVLGKHAIIGGTPVSGNAGARADVEAALRGCGVIAAGERMLGYREDSAFVRMGGESYGAAFCVTVEGRGGTVERHAYAKAIIAGFGVSQSRKAVVTQVERLRLLVRWGIPTPFVYGHDDGTIYMELLIGRPLAPMAHHDVEGPAAIAAILDARGARPLNFVADLMVLADGTLRYVDVGWDLGEVAEGNDPAADRPALRTLLAAFGPQRSSECAAAYAKHYARQEVLIGRTNIGDSQA